MLSVGNQFKYKGISFRAKNKKICKQCYFQSKENWGEYISVKVDFIVVIS